MSEYGLAIKNNNDMARVDVRCKHQHALLYMIPAEKSWVCDQEHLPAHALAGFFGELLERNDDVKDLMQRWGIYFRKLPLEGETPEE